MSIASNVLEVCREHARGACARDASECRYAHARADTEQGKVTACLDYVKGRCSRESCRYFHPPPHLCQRLLDGSLRDGSGGGSAGGQGGHGGGPYSSSAPSSYGGGPGAGYGGQASYGGDYSDDYSHKKSRASYGGGGGGGEPRSHLDELAVLTARHQDEETSMQLGFQGQRAQLEQQQQIQLQTLRARQKNEQLDFLDDVRGGGGGFKRPRGEGMYDGPMHPVMSMMQPPVQSLGYLDQPSHQGFSGRDYQRDGQRDGPRDGPRDGKRDSTLQVCRDFLRNKCARPLCSFAHPSPDVKVDADNRVNVCMDFRLRSCARDTCKFYHAAAPAAADNR